MFERGPQNIDASRNCAASNGPVMAGCGAVGTTGTVQYKLGCSTSVTHFAAIFGVCFVSSLCVNLTADREFSCRKLVTDFSQQNTKQLES